MTVAFLELEPSQIAVVQLDRPVSSYRQILKSSALIGGAQVINILVGIVRTKFLAVLLGPSGMGLASLYLSSTGLIGALTGMGLNSSGVREIAEASTFQDEERIFRTVAVLRKVALATGVVGMLAALVLCGPLSRLTFGDTRHAGAIALVSLTLLFGGISAGQTALLQGLRRLRDLAASQILGGVFGAGASVLLIYLLGQNGIAAYLVAISAFGLLTSWWFARRVRIPRVQLNMSKVFAEARPLLRMGTAFMISALLGAGVAYFSRVLITRQLGIEAVGLFQATWTLSTLYVGFVLNAMSADFYPRLTSSAADNVVVNRLVNEQTEMGLLIAVPGVLATLTLAPWVMKVFYSVQFVPAVEIVRWQIVGVLLRVVSWPLGFVQLAKSKGAILVFTECLFSVGQISLLCVCVNAWKLEGIGIAWALSYIGYTLLMLVVCRRISGFAWSRASLLILAPSCGAVLVTFLCVRLLPGAAGQIGGAIMTALAAMFSFWMLRRLLKSSVGEAARKPGLNL